MEMFKEGMDTRLQCVHGLLVDRPARLGIGPDDRPLLLEFGERIHQALSAGCGSREQVGEGHAAGPRFFQEEKGSGRVIGFRQCIKPL